MISLLINIFDLIPHFVKDTTNYPLRNNNNLAVPFTRTEISRKSCIHSSILLCFKSKLKTLRSDFNNVQHLFICGERYWSVMQARIRKKCSNLNNDLYLNHLCDSPTCRCGFIIEDADHFFFNCLNYTNERVTLFNEIRNYFPIILKNFFSGIIA